MKNYKLYLTWEMSGEVEIDAESLDDAVQKAYNLPLDEVKEKKYITGSWEVEEELALEDYPSEEIVGRHVRKYPHEDDRR